MRGSRRDPKARPSLRRARWGLASRLLAGGVGGYALAQVLPVALVAVAGAALPRADAVLVAMQLSFTVYALAFMGAFAARSACRAWVGIGLAMLGSTAVAWMAL